MSLSPSESSAAAVPLAPGFRFHPTDEELVSYYLRRRVLGRRLRIDAIAEVDLYRREPWDLPSLSRVRSRDAQWYFFARLDRKLTGAGAGGRGGPGNRTNRATPRGYWKTTGKDREVHHLGKAVGMKKTLVFHTGRTPKGERTNRVMHEYRLVGADGTQAPPIEPLDNHQLSLDDLDAIKVIRKGSSGIVQLVRHKWAGQFFALKIIQLNIQESICRQIAQELKISLSTQCQYVVVCYQCFHVNGVISIVLEYMDGGSLADFLKIAKTIPEPYLAAICKQVLKGLMYLHREKHIIHRDLKPSNILINHRGEVKISDFSASDIIASSAQRDTFIGTFNYMAPERISGQKHGYMSDIWSLGLVMLECATGNFPYPPRDSFYELLEAVVDQPPPSAPSDQFSPEFCSFISACIQKKATDRSPAQVLSTHPFLSMYDDLNIDLASYFTTAGSPLATLMML